MPREKKFTEATKTVSFRCPENRVEEFRDSVRMILDNYVDDEEDMEVGGNVIILVDQTGKFVGFKRAPAMHKNPCGCEVTGLTDKGSPIWKRCKEHKKQ